MTQKDFVLLAAALKSAKPNPTAFAAEIEFGIAALAWIACCVAVADALVSTNPRFDRARFLAGCGVQ